MLHTQKKTNRREANMQQSEHQNNNHNTYKYLNMNIKLVHNYTTLPWSFLEDSRTFSLV